LPRILAFRGWAGYIHPVNYGETQGLAARATPAAASDLRLHTYQWQEATVVQCTGRLTVDNAPALKAEVKKLFPDGRRVIVDLTALSYMDSSGLGTIVGLYVSSKSAKCELELVNLNSRIRELLSITNVLSVFEECGRSGIRHL
jgi:anti-sigma B factor antagonist